MLSWLQGTKQTLSLPAELHSDDKTVASAEACSVLQAYDAAIARAITQKKAATGSAHVIDMGTGAGLFALMAARNGADSVIAYDLHETLCSVASKVHPQRCLLNRSPDLNVR